MNSISSTFTSLLLDFTKKQSVEHLFIIRHGFHHLPSDANNTMKFCIMCGVEVYFYMDTLNVISHLTRLPPKTSFFASFFASFFRVLFRIQISLN
jgi:hypothetical protein